MAPHTRLTTDFGGGGGDDDDDVSSDADAEADVDMDAVGPTSWPFDSPVSAASFGEWRKRHCSIE